MTIPQADLELLKDLGACLKNSYTEIERLEKVAEKLEAENERLMEALDAADKIVSLDSGDPLGGTRHLYERYRTAVAALRGKE